MTEGLGLIDCITEPSRKQGGLTAMITVTQSELEELLLKEVKARGDQAVAYIGIVVNDAEGNWRVVSVARCEGGTPDNLVKEVAAELKQTHRVAG